MKALLNAYNVAHSHHKQSTDKMNLLNRSNKELQDRILILERDKKDLEDTLSDVTVNFGEKLDEKTNENDRLKKSNQQLLRKLQQYREMLENAGLLTS